MVIFKFSHCLKVFHLFHKKSKTEKMGGRSYQTCLTKIQARRKVILLHIIIVCVNGEKVLQRLIFQRF